MLCLLKMASLNFVAMCSLSRIVFVLDKIQSNLHKRFRLYIWYERSAKLTSK